MRQLSLQTLLLLVLCISLLIALVVSHFDSSALEREHNFLLKRNRELESSVEWYEKRHNHTQRGAALLVANAYSEEIDRELFNELNSFKAGSICCFITELKRFPSIQMFNFSEIRFNKGIVTPISNTKSVQVLVDRESGKIIDKKFHKGDLRLVNDSLERNPSIEYDFADGSQRKYEILDTGFVLTGAVRSNKSSEGSTDCPIPDDFVPRDNESNID